MINERSLKDKAISGVKWTSVSSIILAFLQLIQVSILARYLSPSDFGLMAIVTVIVGFCSMFMDMGISSAIIHKQDITHRQLSSLYWLNVFSGVALFIFIYLSSEIIAYYYNEPDLVTLIKLLSITFFISSVGNQYRVLNQKELNFNFLAKVEVAAVLISFFVAVVCAMCGYGVYSLVYATLVNVTISNGLFVLFGYSSYKPLLIYKHSDVKELIKFGAFQMGERSINYFNSQFDIILIGKLLGTEALGIYSVAKTFVMKPAQIINPILTKVTFPVMSKLQNDIKKLKFVYINMIYYLCLVNFPIYTAIAVLAEPIVLSVFGKEWLESVKILQVLSIYFMLRSILNPVGALQLARGRADLGFYWNLALATIVPCTIYFGSFYGLIGVSVALLSLQIFINFPAWYFMVYPLCDISFKLYFLNILKPIIITFCTLGISIVVANGFVDYDEKFLFAVVFSTNFIVWYSLFLYRFDDNLHGVLLNFWYRFKSK
ncbi:MOP flippase family protein [Vibrio sp. 10N.261.51.A4]|uniref:MOP flippase family protein n=1 Tax=Vibrio sp. 10N.261.51.A4 TaxID=3229674 RepID=UPI00354C7109